MTRAIKWNTLPFLPTQKSSETQLLHSQQESRLKLLFPFMILVSVWMPWKINQWDALSKMSMPKVTQEIFLSLTFYNTIEQIGTQKLGKDHTKIAIKACFRSMKMIFVPWSCWNFGDVVETLANSRWMTKLVEKCSDAPLPSIESYKDWEEFSHKHVSLKFIHLLIWLRSGLFKDFSLRMVTDGCWESYESRGSEWKDWWVWVC